MCGYGHKRKIDVTDWYQKEFDEIKDLIRDSNSISLCDFLRIRNYKLQLFSTENNAHIEEVTKRAFELVFEEKVADAISKLIEELDGIYVPTASAILAMRFPEKCAIVDEVVIEQLNKEFENEKDRFENGDKNPNVYEQYCKFMLEKAGSPSKLREYEFGVFKRGRERRKNEAEENRRNKIKKS